MFSQLGPLFKTTFRQAESNDTRQAIPHDERDKGRRKREEEEQKEENTDLWQDNMSVTTGALRAFLINFLKTMPGAEDVSLVEEDKPLSARPHERSRPTNTRNAKAVRAYQAMAEQGAERAPTPKKEDKRVEPTADLLQSQELRDIHQLIDDLDVLHNRGVTDLRIQQSESFIQSLKNAVKLQKSKI